MSCSCTSTRARKTASPTGLRPGRSSPGQRSPAGLRPGAYPAHVWHSYRHRPAWAATATIAEWDRRLRAQAHQKASLHAYQHHRAHPPGAIRRVEGLSTKTANLHAKLGYFLPDVSFTLMTPTMSPDERKRLATRILKYGDDPYVSMEGVRVRVAPSSKSYEGGALYVAITEALGHRTYSFNSRHNTFQVV
jgi:hypothetical protein